MNAPLVFSFPTAAASQFLKKLSLHPHYYKAKVSFNSNFLFTFLQVGDDKVINQWSMEQCMDNTSQAAVNPVNTIFGKVHNLQFEIYAIHLWHQIELVTSQQ